MDSQSRKTASAYINNLLLSRGLLRNGTPIEFATPEKAGGVDATMAQVMNLVHDLVLRRDRECDTLASLSQNLQTLRLSTSQQTQNVTRLETRKAELERQLALSETQQRSAHAMLKSAETRNRALREEMARLKGTVGQIRTQCATDIRRRDIEIQRLKRHLEGRRGRDGNGGQVGVVVVTPSLNNRAPQGSKQSESVADLDSPAYSLKQETTEFLTQLSQGLSDENDALIGLVRGTLATLRSLQGLSTEAAQDSESNPAPEGLGYANGLMNGPPSYEALAASTDEVLEHLRSLLTNPSFVPLEEVELREEEILRLREGWEKMAARWKEAIALMDCWKKRMVDTGDTINLDDLKMGMDLGSGIPTVQEAQEKSLLRHSEEVNPDESAISKDLNGDLVQSVGEESNSDSQIANADIFLTIGGTALKERDANVGTNPSPHRVTFALTEERIINDSLNDEENVSLLDFSTYKAPEISPTKHKSRIPLQTQPVPHSPPRTVQQKLDRAQAEAEEALKRDESRARRKSTTKSAVKKKLRGSRRRSTLSPEELEGLMGLS